MVFFGKRIQIADFGKCPLGFIGQSEAPIPKLRIGTDRMCHTQVRQTL